MGKCDKGRQVYLTILLPLLGKSMICGPVDEHVDDFLLFVGWDGDVQDVCVDN